MEGQRALTIALKLLEEQKGKFVGVRFRGKEVDCAVKELTEHPSGKIKLAMSGLGKLNGILLHKDNVKVSRCQNYIKVKILFGIVRIQLNKTVAQFH